VGNHPERRSGDSESFYSGRSSTPVPDPTVRTNEALVREIAGLKEVVFTRLDGMDRAQEIFRGDLTRVPTDTDKQVSNLREQVGLLLKTIEQRLDSADTAITLVRQNATETHRTLQTQIDHRPAEMDARVGHLQDLIVERSKTVAQQFETVAERFRGVETQFVERDVRVKESATATATAVAAALQAAKEAVGEQNKSFTVSIDKSEKATGEQISQQRVALDTATKGIDVQIADIKDRLARIESMGVGRIQAVSETHAAATDTRGTIALMISAGVALFGVISFVLSRAS